MAIKNFAGVMIVVGMILCVATALLFFIGELDIGFWTLIIGLPTMLTGFSLEANL